MAQSQLQYVPLALFIYFPFGLSVCFFIAYYQGHVNLLFTFISDTGTIPPEQYIFAQFVNMGAALYAYFAYVRYVQVEQYMKIRYSQTIPMGNTVGLAFGFITALGMSLVGNFPELYLKEVHILGAFLTFVGGSIYILFQGYYTFKLLPHFGTKEMAYFRTFLGVFGLMTYFGAQTTIILAFQQYTPRPVAIGRDGSLQPNVIWVPADGGYEYQAASVIMEWILMADFVIFIWTFVGEFKKFQMEAPLIKFSMKVESTDEPKGPEEIQEDREDLFSEPDSQGQPRLASIIGSSYLSDEVSEVSEEGSEGRKSVKSINIIPTALPV